LRNGRPGNYGSRAARSGARSATHRRGSFVQYRVGSVPQREVPRPDNTHHARGRPRQGGASGSYQTRTHRRTRPSGNGRGGADFGEAGRSVSFNGLVMGPRVASPPPLATAPSVSSHRPALVVVSSDGRHRPECRNLFQNRGALERVRLHDLVFGARELSRLPQDGVVNRDLANVVQQRADLQLMPFRL